MFDAEVPEKDILKAINQLTEKYADDEYSFTIPFGSVTGLLGAGQGLDE